MFHRLSNDTKINVKAYKTAELRRKNLKVPPLPRSPHQSLSGTAAAETAAETAAMTAAKTAEAVQQNLQVKQQTCQVKHGRKVKPA